MRRRGVHRVELWVLKHEASVACYARMFGWLGDKSLRPGEGATYFVHENRGLVILSQAIHDSAPIDNHIRNPDSESRRLT